MMTATSQPLSTAEEPRWEQFRSHVQATKKCLGIEDPGVRLYALVDTRGFPALRGALERLDMIQFEALYPDFKTTLNWFLVRRARWKQT